MGVAMGTVFLADFAWVRWWVGVVQDGKSWVRWWVGVHESRMRGFRVGTRYSIHAPGPHLCSSCLGDDDTARGCVLHVVAFCQIDRNSMTLHKDRGVFRAAAVPCSWTLQTVVFI